MSASMFNDYLEKWLKEPRFKVMFEAENDKLTSVLDSQKEWTKTLI
ncbi:hypothetical protein ACOYX0_03915 [Enterococcus thailandicus]|uniref:Uncharacterized protein n=2 Tax=Enterococcus TaxID=1350 RepID=A0A510W9K2_ENTTH|nr:MULTISPECIES: hypothetical protein [Enterococcus]MDA3964315.1 hypothetical protein [Enterococcus thailandicus]MDA3977377.1 hypothetical protein [Enterococcus thailandicus]MDK4351511.1 hypothetical protein [Enterococcus thailandicus]MDT2733737.1 hypothetical protein [Enterococcus thailandicus]MDT2750997.1 hypothetical protein [Enterococcus thailandicus]